MLTYAFEVNQSNLKNIQVLRKNPKDPISLFYAAKVKYELGNYEECLTELKKLNDYHPNDPQINFQLGQIYKMFFLT